MALQRFRSEQGEYPRSLSQLLPLHLTSLPEDPFEPGPVGLKYVVEQAGGGMKGQGHLLYSVGPDKVDQGGLARDPLSGIGDLVYLVD